MQEALGGTYVFIEPVDGSLPGQIRRGFVIAFRRGVAIETVDGPGVDVAFVRNAGFFERCVVGAGQPAARAGIELAMCWTMTAALIFATSSLGGRSTVKGHRGGQARSGRRTATGVGDAASVAETRSRQSHRCNRGATSATCWRRGHHVLGHFLAVDFMEQLAAMIIVAGKTADGSESIGGEDHKIGEGEAAGDIFDVSDSGLDFRERDDDAGQFGGHRIGEYRR